MAATLIADDLTGACDAGALFCGRSRVGVFLDAAAPGPEWAIAVVDTESRALGPAAAGRAVRAVAERLGERLGGGLVFKKIDSTLRGAVGAELEAVLAATGRRAALVCPAFPAQGRTVVQGILRVSGIPAHESPTGSDPDYPGCTSDVVEILSRGAGRPVRRLPLEDVRAGRNAIAGSLAGTGVAIIAADAETDVDLDSLAVAAVRDPSLVLAGSAGLARAAAAALGHAGPTIPLPEGRAWLIVCGSLHPASRAQYRALHATGLATLTVGGGAAPDVAPLVAELRGGRAALIASSDEPGSRDETARRLAGAAAAVLAVIRPDLTAVTGGETAHALFRALGASRLELLGSPMSGLALGDMVVNGASTLPLLTKAGGFGPADLFVTLLKGTA